MDILIFVFEIIGTVAFSVSGAMTGLKKNMDIFGVMILGVITAIGGGVIRDLVLGITPPGTFGRPVYAIVATVTAIITFLPAVHRLITRNQHIRDFVLLVLDSLGLGVFTVVGIQTAYRASSENSIFLILFVGVITGVGGGVILGGKILTGTKGAGEAVHIRKAYLCLRLYRRRRRLHYNLALQQHRRGYFGRRDNICHTYARRPFQMESAKGERSRPVGRKRGGRKRREHAGSITRFFKSAWGRLKAV